MVGASVEILSASKYRARVTADLTSSIFCVRVTFKYKKKGKR
jgi:hypothetical protein